MKIDTPCSSQLPSLRDLWQEAFGDTDEFLNNFYITAFSPNRCRCITIDGKIAAVLYWFDCSHRDAPVAYLYAISTAKTFRGQGLCRKLMEDTHRHLATLGYQGAILVPGKPELFKLYEKMGYQTCSHIRQFRCYSGPETILLQPIHVDEYAKLRRQLLPEGGVIQEDENLLFLQTQAKVYKGSDCLLAVRQETETLDCLELLGNVSTAPGILRALGYTEGVFRTPGTEMPFAMYFHLCKSKFPSPTYFGLAFD